MRQGTPRSLRRFHSSLLGAVIGFDDGKSAADTAPDAGQQTGATDTYKAFGTRSLSCHGGRCLFDYAAHIS